VRFTSEGWSSQAGAPPTVRAADLPGRMRPGPPRVPGLAASGVRARATAQFRNMNTAGNDYHSYAWRL
jgi:hypothetical protein